MKVPAHQFDATVDSYCQLGIPVLAQSSSSVLFQFGPISLHVDKVDNLACAEIWLEFVVSDANAAATFVEHTRFERCDDVERLPKDYPGFLVTSPSSIVHLVTETE